MFGFLNRQKKEGRKFQKPYYTILSCHTDKVLDLSGGGEHQGSLIIWDSNKGDNQSFTLSPAVNGQYRIKCKANGQFLTVENGSNGAKIMTAPKSKTNHNQLFRLDQPNPDKKEYVIYTYCGKALDICEASKKKGTQIIQWDLNGNSNQLWHFCDPKNITSSSSEIE